MLPTFVCVLYCTCSYCQRLCRASSFFQSLGKYVDHSYKVLLFIDAYSRPEESVSKVKSGSNAYLREAALQFSELLDMHDLATSHSVLQFTADTSGTWTSHSTSITHTI